MSDKPYRVLANGYDQVMAHVDYPAWAAYVQALIIEFQPNASSITELGCGTGKLAACLQSVGPPPSGYRYAALDGSAAMIQYAEATRGGLPIQFGVAQFVDPVPVPPADVVLLLYDGLNYLLDPGNVSALLDRIFDALVPGVISSAVSS